MVHITIDLDQFIAKIKDDIKAYLRLLPDNALLELLDHFAEHDGEFTDEDADIRMRTGITRQWLISVRRERDRRSEEIKL